MGFLTRKVELSSAAEDHPCEIDTSAMLLQSSLPRAAPFSLGVKILILFLVDHLQC